MVLFWFLLPIIQLLIRNKTLVIHLDSLRVFFLRKFVFFFMYFLFFVSSFFFFAVYKILPLTIGFGLSLSSLYQELKPQQIEVELHRMQLIILCYSVIYQKRQDLFAEVLLLSIYLK